MGPIGRGGDGAIASLTVGAPLRQVQRVDHKLSFTHVTSRLSFNGFQLASFQLMSASPSLLSFMLFHEAVDRAGNQNHKNKGWRVLFQVKRNKKIIVLLINNQET